MKNRVDPRRVRALNESAINDGPVIYWLSREQRVRNNWSLIYAQDLAVKLDKPLLVAFTLADSFLGATWRQYDFMFTGLKQLEDSLRALNIPFILLRGEPVSQMQRLVKSQKAGAVVCDFDPLRIKRQWREQLSTQGSCATFEVDAHNIVPLWQSSAKAEFGAYTIRPKIQRQLAQFLTPYPHLAKQRIKTNFPKVDWQAAFSGLKIDRQVAPQIWLQAGEAAARRASAQFINNKLADYDTRRNDPNLRAQSYLSPYLHFGQISAQEIALELQGRASAASFLEELIVRKELADNFCYYHHDYDTIGAFPKWARETIGKHARDEREYLYSRSALENSETHDELWNAAQRELREQGTMPGYLRMYWAKKILEWTESAEVAQQEAIYLNDKYQLDGRDPNGYTGIAWSIGGVHDRAWSERKVFGKIRYMNYQGCRRKFDVDQYIASRS